MWTTVINAVVKWCLSTLASAGLLGLAWCGGHHAGAVSQAAKDAPVIVRAKADAATGQAQAAITQQTLLAASDRSDHERSITEQAQDVHDAIIALEDAHAAIPADVDAEWRAGIERLRVGPQAADSDGLAPSDVPGGPRLTGATSPATPAEGSPN